MASRSTIRGFWRSKPTKASTPSVLRQTLFLSFDATQASAAIPNRILPAGAVVLYCQPMASDGTDASSTVDIGTAGDSDGFANEVVNGTAGAGVQQGGALNGAPLASDTQIFAGVGAIASAGGTSKVIIVYVMDDDGKA